jgi:hypothetical protein
MYFMTWLLRATGWTRLAGPLSNRGLAIAAVCACGPPPASAHSWYDKLCCHGEHCEPVPDGLIRETREGFLILPTGELLAHSDTRVHLSHDVHFHWCHWQKAFPPPERGRAQTGFDFTICLYVPPKSY